MTDPDFDYDSLDDGIRELVRSLHAYGFTTTDSGDGTKQGMDCALSVPNVHVSCLAQDVVSTARELHERYPEWHVQAHYSPNDGHAGVLMTFIE